MSRPRIAIVSPFIDKRHGTEQNVAECIERLAGEYEIHVYGNHVEDVDLRRITWHRIPALPGPHLFAYLWWFAANHLWRWSGRWVRGGDRGVVFSPGINCLDANVIFVHVVFARFRERMKEQLFFRNNPWMSWHRVAHRRLYYRLIISLERRVYSRPGVKLLAVSGKTAADLEYFYHPANEVRIAHNGLDLSRFNPEKRAGLREEARRALGLSSSQFVLLLIGNDWKSKGLPWLLQAAAESGSPHLCILVAGRDNPAPFKDAIQQYRLAGRVHFLPPRPDVEFYYAAADAYVSPSLEDAFALPPAEAMACGLPIVTSRNNGGSEVVSSGEDGFVLEDPADFRTLANILQRLMSDQELSARISAAAVRTAQKLTWDATAAQVRQTWEEVNSLKGGARAAEWS